MQRSSRRLARFALLVAAIGSSAPSPAGQDIPTFRSGVQLIEVEVRVTDGDGRAVRGLTKDDFTILDDDARQAISTFSFVDLAVESPVTQRTADDVEPDVVTNGGSGRMWVLLLGGFGLKARLVARQFVNEATGPNDQIAVIPVHGTMRRAQGFTSNRALLINAIDRLDVDDPNADADLVTSSPSEPQYSSRIAYEVLEELCSRLSAAGGRRKSIIYFDPPKDWIQQPGTAAAYRDALRCATRNNVVIHTVATEGMSTELGAGPLQAMAAQRALAEDTGGTTLVNTNNFEDGYQRFVEDANQYYLLSYMPSVEHRDGEFHRLTVRVNRPGVTVRARRGYYAAKAEPTTKRVDAPEPAEPGLSADARSALRLPLPVAGLTVDLSAVPFRDSGAGGSVLLTARVHGADLALAPGDTLEVGHRATTTEGRTEPGAFYVFKLDLKQDSRELAASNGLQFVDRITLPAGRHQVNFVVHQPNGKTGMVVADVDVPDFGKMPLSMSGIVIAADEVNTAPTLKMDEPIRELLEATPTVKRSFGRQDEITAYVETYTNRETRAEDVRITATVARATDPKHQRRIPILQTPEMPGRSGYLVRLPLDDVEPGDYVLTFEASRAGSPVVSRHVPIRID